MGRYFAAVDADAVDSENGEVSGVLLDEPGLNDPFVVADMAVVVAAVRPFTGAFSRRLGFVLFIGLLVAIEVALAALGFIFKRASRVLM